MLVYLSNITVARTLTMFKTVTTHRYHSGLTGHWFTRGLYFIGVSEMPIGFFYCPDGGTIAIHECLQKAGCRMVNEGLAPDRCVPRDILQESVKERPYNMDEGVSVTGLEKDALFHWLKAKAVYGVDPTKGASRYIGTAAHYFREHRVAPGDMPEVKLYFDVSHGTSDMVSIDEWTDGLVLSDLKTRSIWALIKMLGVDKFKQPDPSGAVYVKSGKWGRAGTPKMVDVRGQHCQKCGFIEGIHTCCPNCETPMWGDIHAEIDQVNYYRMGWESYGHKLDRMEIVDILRDYGGQAKTMGFDREIYRIGPLPFIDNEILTQDAAIKQAVFAEAMAGDEMPPMCNDEARWHGKFCADFCDVREICPYGGENAVWTAKSAEQLGFEGLPDWTE